MRTTSFVLETTEMYCLTVLEAGSSKSRHQQSHAPSEPCKGDSFLASSSFQRLLAILGSSVHHSNLCFPYHAAISLCVSLCYLFS